jgi:hypothetical protein
MSLTGDIKRHANAAVEQRLRAAILRLADMETDVEIERVAAEGADREQLRAQLFEESMLLHDAVNTLRYAMAFARESGAYHLGERQERALQLAKLGRTGRAAARARQAREAAAAATVTPAPRAIAGALPASTRPARSVKKPPASTGPIHVGGQRLLALGPGQVLDGELEEP